MAVGDGARLASAASARSKVVQTATHIRYVYPARGATNAKLSLCAISFALIRWPFRPAMEKAALDTLRRSFLRVAGLVLAPILAG